MKMVVGMFIALTVFCGHAAHSCREFLRANRSEGARQTLKALCTIVAHGSSGVEACKKQQALEALRAAWMHDVEPLDAQDQVKNSEKLSRLLGDFKEDPTFLEAVAIKEQRLQEAFFYRRALASQEIENFRIECAECRVHSRKIAALDLEAQKARVLELHEKQWQRKFGSFTTHCDFSNAYADDVEREALLANILKVEPHFKEVLQATNTLFADRYKVVKKQEFPSGQEQQDLMNQKEAINSKMRKQVRDFSNSMFKTIIAMKVGLTAYFSYFG